MVPGLQLRGLGSLISGEQPSRWFYRTYPFFASESVKESVLVVGALMKEEQGCQLMVR